MKKTHKAFFRKRTYSYLKRHNHKSKSLAVHRKRYLTKKRIHNNSLWKSKQQGGTFIASGANGAVYKDPSLICEGDTEPMPDSISKIMFENISCDIEYKAVEKLEAVFTPEQLKLMQLFIAIPLRKCKLDASGLQLPIYRTTEWLSKEPTSTGERIQGPIRPASSGDLIMTDPRSKTSVVSSSNCQVLYKKGGLDLSIITTMNSSYTELCNTMHGCVNVLAGIKNLQDRNIIHSDIKPNNIVLFKEVDRSLTGTPYPVDVSAGTLPTHIHQYLKIIDLGDIKILERMYLKFAQEHIGHNSLYLYFPPSATWLNSSVNFMFISDPISIYRLIDSLITNPFNKTYLNAFWSRCIKGLSRISKVIEPTPFKVLSIMIESLGKRLVSEKTFGVFDSMDHPYYIDSAGRITPFTSDQIASYILTSVDPRVPSSSIGYKPFNRTIEILARRYLPPVSTIFAEGSTTILDVPKNPRFHKILKHFDIYAFGIMLLEIISNANMIYEDFLLTTTNMPQFITLLNYIELAGACLLEGDDYPSADDIICQYTDIEDERMARTNPTTAYPAHRQTFFFWKIFNITSDMLGLSSLTFIQRYISEMQQSFHFDISKHLSSFKISDIDAKLINMIAFTVGKHDKAFAKTLEFFNYSMNVDYARLSEVIKTKLIEKINKSFGATAVW